MQLEYGVAMAVAEAGSCSSDWTPWPRNRRCGHQKKSKENGVSDSNITTEKDMLKALDYYFHLVTTTGKAGVYIKKRISPYHYVWYHWRWFISSFICDTVAQEQLEGCAGK